jgi:uncharacterized OB-fold protein
MAEQQEAREPIKKIVTPVEVEYYYSPGKSATVFLRGIEKGKLVGMRCSKCSRVYVPARGSCPRCGVPLDRPTEVQHKGTVTTFCIVRVPSQNIQVDLPYCVAHILLDGADIPFFFLIQECASDQVRLGMRVEAVWKDSSEWGTTFENIRYFRPIDEPDVPFEAFQEHV